MVKTSVPKIVSEPHKALVSTESTIGSSRLPYLTWVNIADILPTRPVGKPDAFSDELWHYPVETDQLADV